MKEGLCDKTRKARESKNASQPFLSSLPISRSISSLAPSHQHQLHQQHINIIINIMARYSASQLAELRKSFSVFDTNGDGQITPKELANALSKLGHRPTRRELKEIMTRIDKDRSGTIDFDEYLEMMAQQSDDSEAIDDASIREMFNSFDLNGDGSLSIDELFRVMTHIGLTATMNDMQAMLTMADSDRNGSIDFEEFKHMILNLRL